MQPHSTVTSKLKDIMTTQIFKKSINKKVPVFILILCNDRFKCVT